MPPERAFESEGGEEAGGAGIRFLTRRAGWLLIAVLGFLTGRPDFLDLALVYGLMNFIGTIAVMKFTRFGDLAGMERDLDDDPAEGTGR